MSKITAAQTVKIVDIMAQSFFSLYGQAATKYGIGDGTWGLSKGLADLTSLVQGTSDSTFRDAELQGIFSAEAYTIQTNITIAKEANNCLSGWFNKLSQACAELNGTYSSIVDIDSFMTYYNLTSATKWQCLAPPEWADIFYAMRRAYPTATNVMFPVIQGESYRGTTFTNALAKYVKGTATYTQGEVVDTVFFCGGLPFIQWSGGSGSGACSITVAGKNQTGATVNYTLSGTWGDANFNATNSGVALTPSVADSLISEVTSVTITGMTAGTFYIEARRPSGRVAITNP